MGLSGSRAHHYNHDTASTQSSISILPTYWFLPQANNTVRKGAFDKEL